MVMAANQNSGFSRPSFRISGLWITAAYLMPSEIAVCDNYNLKKHKYVCITTYQPDTESNPNPYPTLTLLLNSTQ